MPASVPVWIRTERGHAFRWNCQIVSSSCIYVLPFPFHPSVLQGTFVPVARYFLHASAVPQNPSFPQRLCFPLQRSYSLQLPAIVSSGQPSASGGISAGSGQPGKFLISSRSFCLSLWCHPLCSYPGSWHGGSGQVSAGAGILHP